MFDIIGKRNWFFLFSGLILVPGVIFILLTLFTGGKEGLKFSIDYTGGTLWEIKFQNPNVTPSDVKSVLADQGLSDSTVVTTGNGFLLIRTKPIDLRTPPPQPSASIAPSASASAGASGSAGASASVGASASTGASPFASSSAPAAEPSGSASASAGASSSPAASPAPSASPSTSAGASPSASASAAAAGASASPSPSPSSAGTIPTTGKLGDVAKALQARFGPIAEQNQLTTVGAVVSQDLINQAILLIIIGSIGILLWITVRFHDVKMGATALAALLHDVIVVVGIFAILGTLFGTEIDALFVTAMLTIIGFSVHDTIVVYDRIRENKARHAGEPFDRIVNHSILQTFGRSINTSFTVLLTLLALFLFGGSAIRVFVLALLIGITSGTYSSIFNASPLLVVWQLWEDRRKERRLQATRPARRAAT